MALASGRRNVLTRCGLRHRMRTQPDRYLAQVPGVSTDNLWSYPGRLNYSSTSGPVVDKIAVGRPAVSTKVDMTSTDRACGTRSRRLDGLAQVHLMARHGQEDARVGPRTVRLCICIVCRHDRRCHGIYDHARSFATTPRPDSSSRTGRRRRRLASGMSPGGGDGSIDDYGVLQDEVDPNHDNTLTEPARADWYQSPRITSRTRPPNCTFIRRRASPTCRLRTPIRDRPRRSGLRVSPQAPPRGISARIRSGSSPT